MAGRRSVCKVGISLIARDANCLKGDIMRKRFLVGATVAIAAPQVAWAERPSDRAWLDVGAFAAHIDSDLRLDNETLGIEGTRIDFERDLGLDSSRLMPKASVGVRLAPGVPLGRISSGPAA